LFIAEVEVRNLRPGPHLVFQLRNAKEWDEDTRSYRYVKKPYWITTIGALRLIAQRTGLYAGQSPAEFIYLDEEGMPTIISNIPLPDKENKLLPREPWAVRVAIKRKDFEEPIIGMTRFEAVAAFREKEVNGKKVLVLNEIWSKRSPEMTQKCAEADGFRRAFSEEAGHLYLAEELKNEVEEILPEAVTPASVVPLPPTVPAVDQTPATGTNTPRPNEQKQMSPKLAQTIIGAMPEIEKFLDSPEVQKKLAKEGLKVDHSELSKVKAQALASVPDLKPAVKSEKETAVVDKHFGPIPPINPEAAAALAAFSGLKPASEIPAPTKKRGERPKKSSPDNERDVAAEGGITDEDIAGAGTPTPKTDEAVNAREAEEFVDSVANMTGEEAAELGLPDPPEYSLIPDKDQRNAFIARTRKLPEPGADIKSIGDYMLVLAGKVGQPSKNLTVGDWTKALDNLEAAKKEGTLKELLKEAANVPMPEF